MKQDSKHFRQLLIASIIGALFNPISSVYAITDADWNVVNGEAVLSNQDVTASVVTFPADYNQYRIENSSINSDLALNIGAPSSLHLNNNSIGAVRGRISSTGDLVVRNNFFEVPSPGGVQIDSNGRVALDGNTFSYKDLDLLPLQGFTLKSATEAKITNNTILVENTVYTDSAVLGYVDSSIPFTSANNRYLFRGINSIASFVRTPTGSHSMALVPIDYYVIEITDINASANTVNPSKAVISLYHGYSDLGDLDFRVQSGAPLEIGKTYNLIAAVESDNPVAGVGEGSFSIGDFEVLGGHRDTFTEVTYQVLWNPDPDRVYESGEVFAIEIVGNESQAGGHAVPVLAIKKASDNAKTLAESALGSAAMIGLGTEYIADEGLTMIVDSAKLSGKNVFGAIYGGTGKYHTGSRLDLDSATLITGISAMTEKQKLAISAFVEAGWGDSEGHVNQAHVKADHNVYSFGTAMRFFTDSPWYFDASARLGMARFDYTGNFTTESVKFDHSGIYAALHGAIGYAYPITEDTTLDSYLRYSFNYLEGGSENLHNRAQDTFKMDSIRASAFRVGTRVKGYIGENQWLNYRVGAAYEKVVDGDANTKVSGISIDAPSLNGDTGILEIGLAKRPTINSPWGVDVTLKGYAGDRDGIYGSATVNYVF